MSGKMVLGANVCVPSRAIPSGQVRHRTKRERWLLGAVVLCLLLGAGVVPMDR